MRGTSSKQTDKGGGKRGLHPNSLANLRLTSAPIWKPGQSGHPQGESTTACLQRIAAKPLKKPDPTTAPAKEMLAYETIAGGIKGKPLQFKEAWDRLEGKLVERREFTGDMRAITIIVGGEDSKKLVEQLLSGERALPGEKDAT